jgi:AraC-like DNA-binding protein
MPWQTLLEIAAAVNSALLALTLLLSPRLHRTRARTRLAGFLLCVAWLLTTFALVDQGWLRVTRTLQLVDHTLSLVVSALFVDYMSGSLRRRGAPAWVYLPAATFFFVALIGGGPVFSTIRIGHLVLVQVVYTVAATALFARSRAVRAKRPQHLAYLLGGMWLTHVAQVTRALQPDVGWIFDAVPLMGTAFILGLTILVLTDSRTLRAYTQEPDPSPGPDEFGIEALDHFMRNRKPFLDAALKVESLAQLTGVSSRELSKLINQHTGAHFYEYVNGHRVAEARRLLTEPGETSTSVEAIGLLVGFRARSTFYEAFRRVTGQTPAAYRRTHSE